MIDIKIPELSKTIEALTQAKSDVIHAIARGMRAWGEETRTAAIRVTPKDLGNLRDSIFVSQTVDGEKVVLVLGAGGPAAPYALIVHEQLSSKIHWSIPGTGPKYLENPINERMNLLDDDIAVEVERVIKEKGL